MPPEITGLLRNDVWQPFLDDVQLGADLGFSQAHRDAYLAREIWIIEPVRVTEALIGHKFEIFASE